ncbi:Succinate dehydrogenase flavoprotein subunit [Pigmentiphaga humi]|uniref:Succinate dehydrogenase flavoprotein subunit n=1 Tax=Pigmentiphaga humi TaxID=2478468 RepID=A0A3P4B6G9_9BURK|nr:FAD-binding protein [Pigmentiphaga humi]VCU70775.1 Succinate dehydrogenase flavoprotein subunit [Pigmentiphaga humi]
MTRQAVPERIPVNIVDTDVLVIGGGFGGAWAALRAAELGASVVLVDKAYVSRSGASTMSGGITTCPLPGDDLTPWVEEFVTRGDYMCDQNWTRRLMEGQRERVASLEAWGVPISRDDQGAIRRFASRGMVAVRCMQYDPKRATEALREQALAQGVRIVDRHSITELMTSDGRYPTAGRVIGAFGFDVKTGQCTAFRAKRTIVATGQISMKGIHHVDNDTGDGVAMAWRAGARLADLEFSFGGTFVTLMKRYNLGSYNVAVAHGARLINRHGERFMAKYDPVRFERSELSRVVAAFVKELRDGNGPVYLDLRHCDASYWSDLESMAMTSGATVLLSGKVPDPRVHPLPIEATWNFWSGGRGGVEIDLECRATLAGLYAAGATAKNPATGTHASAGAPTAFAMNSGYFAGESAALSSRGEDSPELPAGLVERLAREALAPLAREPSPMTPDRLHDELAALGGSIFDSMQLNAERLQALCERSAAAYREAERTAADHLHDLVKVHEARNIAENALLIYASALDRTESREQFYRSDYPETDDTQWFCQHGVTRTAQGMRFERLPIPLEEYPFRDRPSKPRALSPIAAIFAGTYQPEDA